MSTARETLSAGFLKELERSYAKNGAETLEVLRQTEPAKFLTLIAQIMPKPKEEAPQTGKFENMTREELVDFLDSKTLPLPQQMAADLPKHEAAIKEARKLVRQRKTHDSQPEKSGMRSPHERKAIVGRFKRRDDPTYD